MQLFPSKKDKQPDNNFLDANLENIQPVAPSQGRLETGPAGQEKEKSLEGLQEGASVQVGDRGESTVPVTAPVITVQPITPEMIQEVKQIEAILSEDLVELFKKMDPATQRQFKLAGEDAAKTINLLLHKTKVKVKEIIDVIIEWLKIIPGVNKFFIEQQAKIKIDKLLKLKK